MKKDISQAPIYQKIIQYYKDNKTETLMAKIISFFSNLMMIRGFDIEALKNEVDDQPELILMMVTLTNRVIYKKGLTQNLLNIRTEVAKKFENDFFNISNRFLNVIYKMKIG